MEDQWQTACISGDVLTIHRILSYRKSISKQVLRESLAIASGCGRHGIVRLLLKRNADVSFSNYRALHCACQKNHYLTVGILIAHKADVNSRNGNCIIAASDHHCFYKILTLLINAKGDVHAGDDKPLWGAVISGDNDMVRFLLKHKANVHARNGEILSRAVLYNRLETVQILLDHGARVRDITQKIGYQIVCWQSMTMLNLLFKYGPIVLNQNPLQLLLSCEKRDAEREDPGTYFLNQIGPSYYWEKSDRGVRPHERIRELILRGVSIEKIEGLTTSHFYLLYKAILPHLHRRLRVHEHQTGTQLLDVRKIMWHILCF